MKLLIWLIVLIAIGIWVYANAGGVGILIYVFLVFWLFGAVFGEGGSSNDNEQESQADIQSRLDEDNVMDKDIYK